MREKSRNIWYQKYTVLFLVGCICAFGIFLLQGRTFIWQKDGAEQHYIRLLYIHDWVHGFVRNILAGNWEIPMWDMSIGYGQDINHLFGFDIFNFFAVLCPKTWMSGCYSFLILLRMYLAGFFFLWYCREMKWNANSSLVGALLYVFCGYALYAAVRHPHFVNPMVYLPLTLIGIERIFKGKKGIVFILAIALNGLSGYYFLYMVTFMAVVYAFVRYFLPSPKEQGERKFFKLFLKCMSGYLIGLCIAGVYLLPAIYNYTISSRTSINTSVHLLHYTKKFYLNYLCSFLSSKGIGYWGYMGFSACSVFACIIMCMKKKKTYLIFFGILNLIFLVPASALFLNGFGYVSNRWCFAYAFFIAAMTAAMLPLFFTLSEKQVKWVFRMSVAYLLGIAVLAQIRGRNIKIEMLLFFLILSTCYFLKRKKVSKKSLQKVMFLFVFLEIIMHAYVMYGWTDSRYIGTFCKWGEIEKKYADIKTNLFPEIKEEKNFRVDIQPKEYANWGLLSGSNGLGSYFSVVPKSITETVKELGVSEREMDFKIIGLDGRSALNTLSAVKYLVTDEDNKNQVPYGYEKIDTKKNQILWENQYALPLMYTYDSYILASDYDKLSQNQKEQAMLQGIVLENEKEVKEYPKAQPKFTDVVMMEKEELIERLSQALADSKNTDIEILDGKIHVKQDSAYVEIEFSFLKNSENYLSFSGLEYEGDSSYGNCILKKENYEHVYEVSGKTAQYYEGGVEVLINLGYSEKGKETFTIQFEKAGDYLFTDMKVISQPMENYTAYVEELQKETVEDIKISGNQITAKATLSKDQILCVAIPYSSYWNVRVNGEPAKIQKANGMYMGICLTEGENIISMHYENQAIKIGGLLTGLGLVMLLPFHFIFDRKQRKGLINGKENGMIL